MHILLIVARLAMAEGGIGAVVVDNAVNGIFGDDWCGGLVIRALPFNVYCGRHVVSDGSRLELDLGTAGNIGRQRKGAREMRNKEEGLRMGGLAE